MQLSLAVVNWAELPHWLVLLHTPYVPVAKLACQR
jgi:hypothetical protein